MVDERTSANQERGQYRESTTSMFAARMRDADRAQRQRGGPCGAPRDAPGGPSGGTRRSDRPVPALRLCARHLGLRRVPHGCPALLDDRPLRQPQLRRPASRLLSPKSTAVYLIGHHPIKSANTTTCSKQAAATGEGEPMTMTLKTRLAEPGRLMSVHVCVIPSAVVTQAIAAAGADAVIIDQEHGPIGFETLHAISRQRREPAAQPWFACRRSMRLT